MPWKEDALLADKPLLVDSLCKFLSVQAIFGQSLWSHGGAEWRILTGITKDGPVLILTAMPTAGLEKRCGMG
jgi:hypothetical protein